VNVLVIVCDTLRRDYLGCYGGSVATPAFDALAQESLVFDNAYCGSFPTLPCRAELFTGKIVFPYLNWGPLPRNEVLLSETFAAAHYECALVTDNLPLCRDGYDYDRGFHSRVRIRGQYYDRYRPVTRELPWPADPHTIGEKDRVQQYLHNVEGREGEEDYFAPRTVNTACRWLEDFGRRQPFFLWVDLFDPHEPWDPPVEYVPEAGPDFPWILYPRFGEAHRYSPEELEAIRALYRGEVRLADRWVGVLLRRLEELGLAEETTVVFLSDHGIILGEHNLLGKSARVGGDLRGWPPYVEVARIPLMIKTPGLRPGRTEAFAHPGDITPTLLELAGIRVPSTMKTPSLLPILKGESAGERRVAVSSWSLRGSRATRPSVIRDREWSLVFWRTGMEPELYHRPTDPGETRNIYHRNPAEARRLHDEYVRFLQDCDTPAKNFWPRRWLFSWGQSERWQDVTQTKGTAEG
jgi:arylsulfatase A-like enzyme